jgi:hypothetical protein
MMGKAISIIYRDWLYLFFHGCMAYALNVLI